MIGDMVSGLIGGLVNVLSSVLMLLPQVDISSFGIEPSENLINVLSALNVFIPIKKIVTILGVWAGLILTTNVVIMIKGIANKVASK